MDKTEATGAGRYKTNQALYNEEQHKNSGGQLKRANNIADDDARLSYWAIKNPGADRFHRAIYGQRVSVPRLH